MASGLHPRCTCSTTRRWPTPPAHPPLGSRVSPLSHRPRARSPEQCCTAGQFCTVVPITLPTRIACLPSRSLESIRTRTSVFPALCGYESCPASPSPSVPCLKTVAPATRAMRQMQRHNIVNCSTAAADCAGEKRKKKREREKKKEHAFRCRARAFKPQRMPSCPSCRLAMHANLSIACMGRARWPEPVQTNLQHSPVNRQGARRDRQSPPCAAPARPGRVSAGQFTLPDSHRCTVHY